MLIISLLVAREPEASLNSTLTSQKLPRSNSNEKTQSVGLSRGSRYSHAKRTTQKLMVHLFLISETPASDTVHSV